MKNPKKLTMKQKKFLDEQGLNPNEYLLEGISPYDYTFYNVRENKLISMRR